MLETQKIMELEFPVFCKGTYAKDQKGRGVVVEYNVSIEIGGVSIHSEDLLFWDVDGVVIPKELVSEVIHRALEKIETEKCMILKGVPTASFLESLDLYSVTFSFLWALN